MKATTEDGAFTFEIARKDKQYVATVKNHIAGAYDTTGKTTPGHEWFFDTIEDAKSWADSHLRDWLKVSGELFWEG